MRDNRRLFGNHKTFRGFIAAIITGAFAGFLLGFTWRVGLCAGLLSMIGDLLSSFIKRRAGEPSGSVVLGLDQIFEGFFPLLFLSRIFSINTMNLIFLLIVFFVYAYLGSWFYKLILLKKPNEHYPRKINPELRLRELKSCHMVANPLHNLLNFEDAIYYHLFMKTVFKILGIYSKGIKNALEVRLQYHTIYFDDLPDAFDDYTILFISDLHIDCLDDLINRLVEIIDEVDVDLCVLGGDFSMNMQGPYEKVLTRMGHLAKVIRSSDGIYSVLGNHDCVEMIPDLAKKGISVLLNESISINRLGSTIWLVGVDDPHYYRCHDLDRAFSKVPGRGFSIFTAHSPVIYKEAEKFCVRLYLCGHTHAGQIQIPCIGPVFTHTKAPRRYCYGAWNYNGMTGYTTSGAGVSGVPVRFFTRGEVVHLTLKCRRKV